MKGNRKDAVIVSKILAYCEEVIKTHASFGHNKDLFFNKDEGFIYRNSITMPMLQIGELVKNFSDSFLLKHGTISWKSIARFRDILAHHYGSLDYEMAWFTSVNDIIELKSYLETIVFD